MHAHTHTHTNSHTRNVPNSHRLIEGSTNHQILFRMELCAHDVVIVSSEHGDALSRLPIPNANRLIIGRRQDPRVFMVKEYCSNIVQMTMQSEKASTLLVVPNFDLVVITPGDEQWLRGVKCDTSHRTFCVVNVDRRTGGGKGSRGGGRGSREMVGDAREMVSKLQQDWVVDTVFWAEAT